MSLRGAGLALLALPVCGALQAQSLAQPGPIRHFSDAEIAAVAMPALAFEETPEAASDYDKFFYFHRADTSFDEAYSDVIECDAVSSGSRFYAGVAANDPVVQSQINNAMMQYGAAGAVGGALGGVIGSVIADAIWGAAERRRQRRVNVRNCMHFKGYSRYPLTEDLWREFNFAEGNGRAEEEFRAQALMMQARVASGPKPQREVLEP